jgi:hypothetical protein
MLVIGITVTITTPSVLWPNIGILGKYLVFKFFSISRQNISGEDQVSPNLSFSLRIRIIHLIFFIQLLSLLWVFSGVNP